MPLPERRANRVRESVHARLPPATLTATTPAGGNYTINGYLDDRRGGLDALGQPEREARLYVHPSEPTITAGDMLEDRWVAWAAPITEGAWQAVDLRRLPTFEEWTRTTRVMTGRDPRTRAPLYDDSTSTIDAYLLTARFGSAEEAAHVDPNAAGALIVPAGTAALAVGDRVSHPTHGTFRVASVAPYGPWARATVEAE